MSTQLNKTQFDKIYQIKMEDLHLRELLLMQSIFQVERPIDISTLVQEQPKPTVFFKVFLELELNCMVTYLAFDSRSIQTLLDESNKNYFRSDQPIFFRGPEKRTAIDAALDKNQIKSVSLMIEHIVKH